jgi:collagen type III alpha
VGQEKRKELEKLANDLKSPDPDTKAAAEKKLDEMMKNATADKGDKTDAPKLDPKQKQELADAAKNLNSPDPKKKQEAEQKLDKAIGEEKRKEMQKLAKDLKSDDPKTKAAAEQKLKDMMEKATADKGPDKTGAPKPDEKQMKEFADALKDLQSPDPKTKEDAQKKLDKMVGEKDRKEIEQLMNDLNSRDEAKQQAAQKKLDDLKKEIEKQANKDGKGKELSKEEIAELAKKAQDLNSMDDAKRQQAEKDLDEKLGKENRDKLQEALKNQKPGDPKMDPEQLKKQLEQLAQGRGKKNDDFQPKGMATNPPAAGPMDDDPKNRLRTAELLLDEFEKNRYNKELQAKKGWTQDEYDRFLEGYRKRVEDLRNEVERADKPATTGPGDPGGEIKLGSGGKVEGKKGKETTAGVTGAPVEPPGFEGSRDRFKGAIKKKKP